MIFYLVDGVKVDPNGNPIEEAQGTDEQDLTKLNKDELVKLAEDKGVDSSGNKAEIVARLEAK
jgi:hypothetical protein